MRPWLAPPALRRRPEVGALVSTAAVLGIFSATVDGFLTAESMASMLTIAAELGIVAMAVTMLMIAGEFDLSVGSVLGLCSVLVPYSMIEWGVSAPLAVLLALLAGCGIGLLNGVVFVRTGIPSFIVTLGALMIWRGVVNVLTEGYVVNVPGDPGVLRVFSHRFDSGLTASVFWLLGLAILLTLVLNRTRFGNHVFAIGGNVRAARSMGIPVNRVRVTLFAITGAAAALAAVIQVGRFTSVSADRGSQLELEAIAAAVIGGTHLAGGYGSIVGTVLGCVSVAAIRNGLALGGVASYWYTAAIGGLIIVAVIVNRIVAKRLGQPV
jgi:simple sugar transport system permease protein